MRRPAGPESTELIAMGRPLKNSRFQLDEEQTYGRQMPNIEVVKRGSITLILIYGKTN